MANSHNNLAPNLLVQALEWHLENGADEMLSDAPIDRTKMPELPKKEDAEAPQPVVLQSQPELIGAAEAKLEAVKLAQEAQTLEGLAKAISDFDGVSVKKTATNMVFADGNPKANVMVIGEAPGADEDRAGKPFVGASGKLLDVILSHVGLNRTAQEPESAVYLSNILNWRPPGNRTPTPAEVEVSIPFIERHIELIQPKMIIIFGGVAAQSLLSRSESISKLRGQLLDYKPITLSTDFTIPCIATYHPGYLIQTPAQKGKVWADMLMLKAKLKDLGTKAS